MTTYRINFNVILNEEKAPVFKWTLSTKADNKVIAKCDTYEELLLTAFLMNIRRDEID